MALPIPLNRTPPVKSVPDGDAVRAAYALLQELHDHGVIDFFRGLAGAGGDLATRLAEAINTPEAIAGMRNLVSLIRILGAVDPEILHGVAKIVSKAPTQSHSPQLLTTLRRLGSRESRRAFAAVAYGVQVFGRVLISRQLSRD